MKTKGKWNVFCCAFKQKGMQSNQAERQDVLVNNFYKKNKIRKEQNSRKFFFSPLFFFFEDDMNNNNKISRKPKWKHLPLVLLGMTSVLSKVKHLERKMVQPVDINRNIWKNETHNNEFLMNDQRPIDRLNNQIDWRDSLVSQKRVTIIIRFVHHMRKH